MVSFPCADKDFTGGCLLFFSQGFMAVSISSVDPGETDQKTVKCVTAKPPTKARSYKYTCIYLPYVFTI